MKTSLNVGIVGCGNISSIYMQNMPLFAGVKLRAVADISPDGVALVGQGQWRARTNRATPISAGDRLRVVAIDGFTLEVEPEFGAAKDHRERAKSTE